MSRSGGYSVFRLPHGLAAALVAVWSVCPSPGSEIDPALVRARAEIQGVIRVRGEPPQLPPIAQVGGLTGMDIQDESLVIGPSAGLANVFVWLPDAPRGGARDAPPDTRLLKISSRFVPRAFLVPVGSQLQVINADEFPLSLHIVGERNSPVSVTIPAQQPEGVLLESDRLFRRSESLPTRIRSDFDRHMRAYMLSLDHPFAAVTDEHGRFSIAGLPAGEYDISLWHERSGYLEQKLRVRTTDDRPGRVLLEYPVERFLPADKGQPAAAGSVP